MTQPLLLAPERHLVEPFKTQLLKWIGNKQRVAHEIIRHFPPDYRTYLEPFLGSGAVMGTLAPESGRGSDVYGPLVGIFQQLHAGPEVLIGWYAARHALIAQMGKVAAYEHVLAHFNAAPNPADFVFLTRACYGGVVRFRAADGYMSTPCGAHQPITPAAFAQRVHLWAARLAGCTFAHRDYREAFAEARLGDLIYCDPPYVHSQTILYGAQKFDVAELFGAVEAAANRGVRVAVSLDGRKKSSADALHIDIPDGLFARTEFVDVGISMLDRFQSGGMIMDSADVHDRLLLTY
ncbi:DNA adenine methylase [Deinococcus arenicola]|uniref:site-specific DNA-methyltransferase (adenine-specific) n=1 Tax=Deinococcus arenicola TaxID=2994950 RepID=A0ABU4DW41_9DEIO|nr:DNA adenine methylase [Deinococcus sp. ZS9-10]MDV6376147.1 DNA adenine methylase [Deinococcus sp. ZS9-10]